MQEPTPESAATGRHPTEIAAPDAAASRQTDASDPAASPGRPVPAGKLAVSIADVSFPSISPFVLRDLAAPDGRAAPVEVGATLCLPPGANNTSRRPAVVILHGLGGIIAERETAYGIDLARQGYVTLVVDSFGCRGAESMGHTRRALRVTESMILADAYAALRFLARHPAVRRDRIAVMGFSYGAMVSIIAAYEQVAELLAPGGPRFAGHVSFYGCSVARFARSRTTGAPVALLLGERDANVSLPRSRLIRTDLERGGSPVTFTVYPNAYHQWDGADRAPRHVRFSLAPCRLLVDADGHVCDQRTGFRMRGPASRCAILARNIGLGGYVILRDPETKKRSDADLARFLDYALRA